MTTATDDVLQRAQIEAAHRAFERLVGRVFGNLHLEHPELTRERVRDVLRKQLEAERADGNVDRG